MIHIKEFSFNTFQTRCCVVWDEDKTCAFVDPGDSTSSERSELVSFVESKGLKPACIMLTHAHFDHIYGVADLARTYGIPVYMDRKEAFTVEDTNPYVCGAYGLPLPEKFETEEFPRGEEGGAAVKVGEMCFEVLETPGHTVGGVCFLERSGKVLFSGDTLFAGAIGRTDHPGGDYDLLMKSIFTQLMALDGDIAVIPGHGPVSDIATERMTNPFLLPFNEPYEE